MYVARTRSSGIRPHRDQNQSLVSPTARDGPPPLPQVAHPSLLRGMPTKHILQNFSDVLRSNTTVPRYYTFSEEVKMIDTFLSHTWSTPGFSKFLVLIFHYNLAAALMISLAAAGLVCVLTARGCMPSILVVGLATEVETPIHRGVLCLPVGIVVFFVSLFGLHELDRFEVPWRRKKIFLDRCCIHQTDMELKKKGIESLAAFLCHSREILVCYSENYLERLWTTYEVASWLALRRGEPMTVRPIFAPKPLLATCLAGCAPCALWALLAFLKANHPQITQVFEMLPMVVSTAFFITPAWIGGIWASHCEKMESDVANFRLSNARCFCEADRAFVVANIAKFMRLTRLVGETETEEEIAEVFEELVHKEVPGLIRTSLSRVGIPYTWILVTRWANVLVSLDWAAGWPLDGRSVDYMLWYGLHYAILTIVVSTLVDAMLIAVCFAFRRSRTYLGYLFLTMAACIMQNVAFYTFDTLTKKGLADGKWLVVLAFLYAILLAVTVQLFRAPLAGSGHPSSAS